MTCYVCGANGHLCCAPMDAAFKSWNAEGDAKKKKSCCRCGGVGHVDSECAQGRRFGAGSFAENGGAGAGAASVFACFRCGEKWSHRRECPGSLAGPQPAGDLRQTLGGGGGGPADPTEARKARRPSTAPSRAVAAAAVGSEGAAGTTETSSPRGATGPWGAGAAAAAGAARGGGGGRHGGGAGRGARVAAGGGLGAGETEVRGRIRLGSVRAKRDFFSTNTQTRL